jgi:hypothetical protein
VKKEEVKAETVEVLDYKPLRRERTTLHYWREEPPRRRGRAGVNELRGR